VCPCSRPASLSLPAAQPAFLLQGALPLLLWVPFLQRALCLVRQLLAVLCRPSSGSTGQSCPRFSSRCEAALFPSDPRRASLAFPGLFPVWTFRPLDGLQVRTSRYS